MAEYIDVRGAGGDLKILGGALVLPTQEFTVIGLNEGSIRYNTDNTTLECYYQGSWHAVGGSSGGIVSGGTLDDVTISGGTINSASIGASSPSTGAFTTLSAAGPFTVNNGALGSGAPVTLTTSAQTSSGTVLNFASTTGVSTGMTVYGTNIPYGTTASLVGGTTVTLSQNVSGTVANGAAIHFVTKNNLASFSDTNSNSSLTQLSEWRNGGTSDWTTATRRFGHVIDITDQAFIEFSPPSYAGGFGIGVGQPGSATYALYVNSSGQIFLTGQPQTPTPSPSDNSTTIASTAFVRNVYAAPPAIGNTTPNTGAFTTLSASSTVSGAGFTTLLSPYAPLASPALTGTPTAPTATTSDNSTAIATTAFVKAQNYVTSASSPVVTVAGRGGNVVLTHSDITDWNSALASPPSIGSTAAGSGAFTTLSASSTVSGAGFTTLLSPYAPLASPALTGTPTAPTATTSDNSTAIATTAFVKAQNYVTSASSPVVTVAGRGGNVILTHSDISDWNSALASPPSIGSTAAGSGAFTTLTASSTVSGTGFTNLLAPYAPLASPGLTGSPTAPTQAAGDNSTKIATTAYVQTATQSSASISTTGGSTTLSAAQYSVAILLVTGTLTSNATLVVPNTGIWTISNGTTGAFTLTIKTASGTGVTIDQGQQAEVIANGTNVVFATASGTVTPLMDGAASAGSGSSIALANHVHPTDTSRAPTANPTFSGTVNLGSGTVTGSALSTYLASPPSIGSTAANTGAFTTLSASSTVSGAGITSLFASPPAIGGTIANTGFFTTLTASSTVSGSGFATLLAPYAPLASPVLTGSPTAPTQAAGDNSTKIATTAYVQSATQGSVSVSTTGGSTTLSAAQYSAPIILASGTLTSNATFVMPNTGVWTISNSTSGAFTLTIKTASGTGVTIDQGQQAEVIANGINVVFATASGTVSPQMDGVASAGSGSSVALANHVHPTDTSRAPTANPTFSGTVNFGSGTLTGSALTNYFASPPSIGNTAANTGAFTTLSASSTVSGTGFSNYLASPPPIGSTAPNTGSFTTLSASDPSTSSIASFNFSASNDTNGVNVRLLGNGSTTPSKTIRVINGVFQVVNDAYTTVLLQLSDAGSLSATAINSTPIGGTTASTGAFTTLSASSTVSGTGFSTYMASPPAIGSTAANTGAFTTLSASSTVSGAGITSLFASPPAIGGTAPSTGEFTGLGVNSTAPSSTGLTFGSQVGSSTTDLSKHLALWGTTYGLNITASRLNLVVPVNAAAYVVVNGSDIGYIGSTGLNAMPVGATTASTGAFTNLSASGTVSGTGFINLLAPYAPLASPAFIGNPTAPTQAIGDNSTKLATTAYVQTATQSSITISTTGGSTTLTAAQYSVPILIITGTLASNATLIMPTTGIWTVCNATTGAFTVTLKPAAGTGVTIDQGQQAEIIANGTNVVFGTSAGTSTPLMDGAASVGSGSSVALANHVHPTDTSRAPTASPTFTGTVNLGSGTLTGSALTSYFASPPSIGNTAANTGAFTTLSASSTVSGAGFTSLLAPYAPLASPALTGTPTAPTAAVNTNSTQIATTAYVVGQAGTSTPNMDGSAATGTSLLYARQDHVHPTDTTRAPLASPALTGTPTAPTAANGTNSTQLATTAFVLATNINQLAAPTANVSWNNVGITNLAAPVNPNDAATKTYVDASVQGLQIKPTARLATAAALPANTYNNGSSGVGATLTANANGALSVDGVVVAVGDVILVKNEATAANNGLYTVTAAGGASAAYVLTRHIDMQTASEFAGAFVPVGNAGTTNANSLWLANPSGAITVGTTSIPFTQLNGATDLIAGTGVSISGNTISISSSYTGQTSITTLGTIATGTWNGSTVGVPYGGTGATTLTGYVYGNGTGAMTASTTIPNTAITGLGTMSTQAASAVAITGGTINGTSVGASTASTGAFTTLSASSTVSGAGFTAWAASPPAIGSTAANSGAFTTLSASSTVSGAGFTTLLAPYAPLASPALTGNPTAPTQSAGDNSTKLATTAYVQTATQASASISTTGGSTTLTATQYSVPILLVTGTLTSNATLVVPNTGVWTVSNGTTGAFTLTVKTSAGTGLTIDQGQQAEIIANGTNVVFATASGTVSPLMNGAASAGSGSSVALANHVHPTDTSRAPIASPTFTGTVTVPGAISSNSSGFNLNAASGVTALSVSDPGVGKPGLQFLYNSTFNTWSIVGSAATNINFPQTGGGAVTAPTAAVNTNTTQIATTAFVVGQAGTSTPNMDGTAATGTSLLYARQDHVHPTDTSRAPIASPTFTGTVTIPTLAVTGSVSASNVLAGPNGSSGAPSWRQLSNSDISGLGTMATQNASSVAITGGTIDNIILDGGNF